MVLILIIVAVITIVVIFLARKRKIDNYLNAPDNSIPFTTVNNFNDSTILTSAFISTEMAPESNTTHAVEFGEGDGGGAGASGDWSNDSNGANDYSGNDSGGSNYSSSDSVSSDSGGGDSGGGSD